MADTPPPFEPPAERAKKPKLRDIARAALDRHPARSGDQMWYWGLKATKELGFPVVVALLLLLKMPTWIREAAGIDAGIRQEQHAAMTKAVGDLASVISADQVHRDDQYAEQGRARSDQHRDMEGVTRNITTAIEGMTQGLADLRSDQQWLRGQASARCPPCQPCPSVNVFTPAAPPATGSIVAPPKPPRTR